MPPSVVISQPMYFPWVGMLEQVRLSDVFVYYDDVQFARGFLNLVQVKTEMGVRWITVPMRDQHHSQKLDEIAIDDSRDWRQQHRDILKQAYRSAPFRDEMLGVMDAVFAKPLPTLADVSRESMSQLIEYFGLAAGRRFENSRPFALASSSSRRLLDIVQRLNGRVYITGHGARNYLDHAMFEQAGVTVRYMQYERVPYPQLHGPFTPYVSSLDLIANCGGDGAAVIRSSAVDWKSFLAAS